MITNKHSPTFRHTGCCCYFHCNRTYSSRCFLKLHRLMQSAMWNDTILSQLCRKSTNDWAGARKWRTSLAAALALSYSLQAVNKVADLSTEMSVSWAVLRTMQTVMHAVQSLQHITSRIHKAVILPNFYTLPRWNAVTLYSQRVRLSRLHNEVSAIALMWNCHAAKQLQSHQFQLNSFLCMQHHQYVDASLLKSK